MEHNLINMALANELRSRILFSLGTLFVQVLLVHGQQGICLERPTAADAIKFAAKVFRFYVRSLSQLVSPWSCLE